MEADGKWHTMEYDSTKTELGLEIQTANGFTTQWDEVEEDCVRVLADLTRLGETITLPDGQTIFLEKDGALRVHDVDPWMNKGFEYKDYICEAKELAFVVKSYLESKRD